ncbi:MAG: hypothetical protein KAJ07_09570, partial [Planctomycetes bacterium]|nr:hypothetical protein [Planctomycetota bacterium]
MKADGKLTFPGGVHPPDNKHLSENCQIQLFPNPKQVVVMLSQHIGAPCNALVEKREGVTAGQKIGDNDSFVCAPVHSPVDGKVKDIALASHPVLGRSMAIFIDVDQDSENNKRPC